MNSIHDHYTEALARYNDLVDAIGAPCSTQPGTADNEITEYIINRDGIASLNATDGVWVYKGLVPGTPNVDFVIVVKPAGAAPGMDNTYYQGRVLCPKICGKHNAEMCDGQLGIPVTPLSDGEAAASIAGQIPGLLNAIGLPPAIITDFLDPTKNAQYIKVVFAGGIVDCFINDASGASITGCTAKATVLHTGAYPFP